MERQREMGSSDVAGVLVVGSSAGGSEAVEHILTNLSPDAGYAALVVQHMLPSFTRRFADRLDGSSGFDVRESGFEDVACGGECLVAKGDHHMEVTGYRDGCVRVELTKERTDSGLRPSIDVTMSSAAEAVGSEAVGVVLSGMGSDGVEGLTEILGHGGETVAQDRETSGVYGMPKRAVEADAVDHVLPREEIPEWLRERI